MLWHTALSYGELAERTPLLEKLRDDSNQISECEIVVSNEPFNLVEFSQMGGVQGFISEHPVDREVFLGCEDFLLACKVSRVRCLAFNQSFYAERDLPNL